MKSRLMKGKNAEPDLEICAYGIEQCLPCHYYGPAIREYYLIHFILSGQGIFQYKNKKYSLKAGQGFLICPSQITYYQADAADPWHYVWLGFRGRQAEAMLRQSSLGLENQIIDFDSDMYSGRIEACIKNLSEVFPWKTGRNYHLLGSLYQIFAALHEFNAAGQPAVEQLTGADYYIRQALEFMQMNYSRKISICEMAKQIGLDRSYFGTLFRQQVGTSPQQYLLNLRMEKACAMLKINDLPVAAVARSVGYNDPLLFSRMFSKVIGSSPSDYRRGCFGAS